MKQPDLFEQHVDISRIIRKSREIAKKEATDFINTHSCIKDMNKMRKHLETSYQNLK